MRTLRTKANWLGAGFKVLALILAMLLMLASVGWGVDGRKRQADPLTDQEVVQVVRKLFEDDPSFVGRMVNIIQTDDQMRTLVITFKGDKTPFEIATDLLKSFIAGGPTALLAEQRIQTVTVLFLGGARNLAFQASVMNINLLLAKLKTPEAFFKADVLAVDLDTFIGGR